MFDNGQLKKTPFESFEQIQEYLEFRKNLLLQRGKITWKKFAQKLWYCSV